MSGNTIEALFFDALRKALETVLERAAAQVQPPEPGPLGLSIPDAATYLGVTETAMRELCKQDGFPATKVSGKYIVSRAGLSDWLARECDGRVG